ncbi:hypothetical protein EV356DRAFT_507563 [Viridothelium virens]|uniref:Uncharacterized protein n=1 Tax=Viridothelium virens TaxID=1048519 RepID=A0A6A6HLL1_VIRVR|nr:hypothetical protein EV356DRAFT_507563 [Viridothelium virens]
MRDLLGSLEVEMNLALLLTSPRIGLPSMGTASRETLTASVGYRSTTYYQCSRALGRCAV